LFEIDLSYEESPTVTSNIFEDNQSMADTIPIIVEMDRCSVRNDENDIDDDVDVDEDDEKENSEQGESVKPSTISIPLIYIEQPNPTKTSFEQIPRSIDTARIRLYTVKIQPRIRCRITVPKITRKYGPLTAPYEANLR
jgi:hypothetical protein